MMLKPAFLCRTAIIVAFCLVLNGAPSTGEGGANNKYKQGSKKNPYLKDGKRAIPKMWIDNVSVPNIAQLSTHQVTFNDVDIRVETTREGNDMVHASFVWIEVFPKDEEPEPGEQPPPGHPANGELQTFDPMTNKAYWTRNRIVAPSGETPGTHYTIVVWARYDIGGEWSDMMIRHDYKAVTLVYPPAR